MKDRGIGINDCRRQAKGNLLERLDPVGGDLLGLSVIEVGSFMSKVLEEKNNEMSDTGKSHTGICIRYGIRI